MARNFFENLPSTTTPLTATRLNGLLDGDEAMGNILVDSIKSKNLFDENQILNASGWTKNDSGYYNGTANNLRTYFLSIPNSAYNFENNTQYTFSWTGYLGTATNVRLKITYTDDTTSGIAFITSTTSSTKTGTSELGKTIRRIDFDYGDTGTFFIKNIQLEKGTTATNYAPYISFSYKEPIIISKEGTGTPTSFTLPEDISQYKYVDFVVARSSDYGQAVCRVYYDTWYTPNVGHANMFYTDSNSSFFIESIKFSISGKNVTITAKTINIFEHSIDSSDNIAFRLLAVYGYK